MHSFKEFTRYFGISLADKEFQNFLATTFVDLTPYNILEGDYIVSESNGIDLGFTNNDAIYDDDDNVVFEEGKPIFSHFILYPKSSILIDHLPFDSNFENTRTEILNKAGNPTQSNEGYSELLGKSFLVDNYKVGDIIVTFDYDTEKETINSLQVRDNDLVEHLRL